jgi:DNA-directed RNA polymerase specialized sigma24 family protein
MNLLSGGQSQSSRTGSEGDLTAYNTLILQLQDQAFTLACDLLGDEDVAVEVLQKVFLNSFKKRSENRPGFTQEILRRVLQACLKQKSSLVGPAIPEFSHAGLSNEEVIALVLVDRLELSYPEAAEVTGCNPLNIRKRLAEARYLLSQAG